MFLVLRFVFKWQYDSKTSVFCNMSTVSRQASWTSRSVVDAVLAFTAQSLASQRCLGPACQVSTKGLITGFWCTLMLFIFASAWYKVLASGFFCLEGSQSSSPRSSMFGGICPVGHYCTESISVPSPCPAGSYQNETGGKGKHDCKPCPPGMQNMNIVSRMISSWDFHQCLNVVTRLVPGVFRADKVRALSSRVPLPGSELQPSALSSWLHLSWQSSSFALPQRHL